MREKRSPGARVWGGLTVLVGLVAALLAFGVGSAFGSSIIYKCTGVQATDQPALNTDINSYDLVRIQGTCVGNFLADTMNVTIQGQGPDPTLQGYDTTDPVLTVDGEDVALVGIGVTGGRNDGTGANGAVDGGGGIYAHDAELYLSNTRVTGNEATGVAGSGVGDEGGGVYLHHAFLYGDRSGISHNTATEAGGGIVAAYGSPVVLNNSTVSNNEAYGGIGGGISLDYSSSQDDAGDNPGILFGTTVSGNYADANPDAFGGGINVNHQFLITLSSVISNNTAEQTNDDTSYGGGVFAKDSNTLLLATTCRRNAADYGGCVHNEGFPYSAVIDGGAPTLPSTLTLPSSVLKLPKPITLPSSLVGKQLEFPGGLIVAGLDCERNVATYDGGCINNDSYNVECTDHVQQPGSPNQPSECESITPAFVAASDIEHNQAGQNGGAIANTSESGAFAALEVAVETKIYSNTAGNGGGAVSDVVKDAGGAAEAEITDGSQLMFNRAPDGGAILLDGGGFGGAGAFVALNGGTAVTRNTATDDGGGVYLGSNNTTLIISGATVSNNTPSGDDIS